MRGAAFLVGLCLTEGGCGRIGFDETIGRDDALGPRAIVPVTIVAQSNLWGAGHATPPAVDANGEGVLPAQIDLPAGAGRFFTMTITVY